MVLTQHCGSQTKAPDYELVLAVWGIRLAREYH